MSENHGYKRDGKARTKERRIGQRQALPTCAHRNRDKTSYRSEAAARKASRKSQRSYVAYKCRYCEFWHLATKRPS